MPKDPLLLIGSTAAHFHNPAPWPSPNDIDTVMTWEGFQDFVQCHSIDVAPLGKDKFIGQWRGRMMEFEIAWPNTSAMQLLQRAEGKVHDVYGMQLLVPSMDWLFTLKASHRFKKNDPHFYKTLKDYHVMKALGCRITDSEWLALRERETYTAKRPRLNTTKREFFADAARYEYDHDSLHLAVAHLDRPAYEFYKSDDEEVLCSREKWDACSEQIKLYGVLEEAYVLALERSQIPHGNSITPCDSFMIALMKVCTSITSGWFREYAYENYYNVYDMYSDDYVKKFQKGLQDGVVLRTKEKRRDQ